MTEGYAQGSGPGSPGLPARVGINWGAAFSAGSPRWASPSSSRPLSARSGAAVSVTRGATTVDQAANQIREQDPQTVGILGIVLLAAIAFVSYYGGGYVAARMSRFQGARQGFAVWVWAVVVAIVVAVLAAVAGARYDVLSTINTYPRLPVNQGTITGNGVVALVVLLLVTLAGAVVGGLGGMRYHRRLEAELAAFSSGREDPYPDEDDSRPRR